MISDYLIAFGGITLLFTIWVTINLVTEKVRTIQSQQEGGCNTTNFRCLGCFASGKCKPNLP